MRVVHAGHPRTTRSTLLMICAAAAATATVLATGQVANAVGLPTAADSTTGPLSAAAAAKLSTNVDQHVIVMMRTQPAAAPAASAAATARAQTVSALQAPLMAELRQVHAAHVKSFTLVNSFAAVVSKGEAARLKANPSVAQVIPDLIIRAGSPGQSSAVTAGSTHTKAAGAAPSARRLHVIPNACGKNGKVLLEPEGLSLMHADSDDASAPTAHSLGITGAGVKVAWIADGIDPNNINFLRANGKSVFSDYQDFTGDGPGVNTDGDEAFLDANAIAGQGRHVYDVSHYSAQTYPTACNVRIEGVAPGASLVGLNVFGVNEETTTSNFLQAINYAVQTDHVNVINESFGSNPFPDVTSLDATSQFDDAAVAAGVSVTASSGDAGYTNTIGSPATDPKLIGVGASTDLRFYAQTDYADARYFATTGWLSDNISSLSSSGFDENNHTVAVVAPGELSFASCNNCASFTGQPSDVEESGGTSQSAPMTAGAAALVIQAYRQSHHGSDPTPALVKKILVSTATDLGAPADEQGAGLVNAYKAVQMAQAVNGGKGQGSTLMKSTNALSVIAAPGTAKTWPVTVTNTGTKATTVSMLGRALGPDSNVQSGKVRLSDTNSPQIVGFQGLPNIYRIFHFTVAPGQDLLSAQLAYPGNPSLGNNQRVRMLLIDPKGRFAAHSLPQGVGNYGRSDVTDPAPGRWTGVMLSITKADGGTNGVIPWRVATQTYQSFGSVSPSSVRLAPGASRTISVRATTRPGAGDRSGSIVFASSDGSRSTLPVTLRSTIGDGFGGTFSGTLTGGNGRPNGQGQEQFYQFKVKPGVHDITADTSFADDPTNPVAEYLIAPDGDALGYGQNSTAGVATTSLTAYTLHPVPGMWTLIVDFAEPVAGNQISQHYTGDIRFNNTNATAPKLPHSASTTLAAGQPVTVPVRVTNNGAAPEAFFVDARLNKVGTVPLVSQDGVTSVTLPLTGSQPYYFVPSQVSTLSAKATGSLPIMFDLTEDAGSPDLSSHAPGSGPLCARSESASYTPSGGTVAGGAWFVIPSECGPYAGPAPAATAKVSAQATMRMFDTAVTSDSGDAMALSVNTGAPFTPVVIQPGKTGTINVTITPSGARGSTVRGDLYVDDFMNNIPPYGQFAGNELTSIPYAYTIG